MATFNPYFDRHAFDPTDTVILARAIDEACEALRIPAESSEQRPKAFVGALSQTAKPWAPVGSNRI